MKSRLAVGAAPGLTILGAVTALAIASSASATVMVEVPLEEMIWNADAIVHGTVTRSGVRMVVGDDGQMLPNTITTIRVHEWIAGPGGQTVELRELGGEWQGGGLRYEGTPRYREGEQVVVFLERRPEAPHDFRTFAMVQGKFVVRPGVPGVADQVTRELDGVAFASWVRGRQTVSSPRPQPVMALSTFLDYVRATRGAR